MVSEREASYRGVFGSTVLCEPGEAHALARAANQNMIAE
jgi:hypothetical protein